jgi:hypothetical protein
MTKPDASEFSPLPRYAWDSRPETFPLSVEESESALYLAGGDLKGAADLLRVTVAQLNKLIRKTHRLQSLIKRMPEP